MKNRDHSLTLEGLVAAQSRLSAGHPLLPVLAAKQSSVEAGIGGEERVAEIFRRHSFSFTNHLSTIYPPHPMKDFKWTLLL